MSWEPFDQAAARYDAWYDTPRGQRVERAERALLDELLTAFPGADSLLDVGCGTGRFSAWLAPAFRVARRGLILIVLNRWSVGSLSRRAGAQARSALLAQARDVSPLALRAMAMEAAGARLVALPWASTLFPDGLWAARGWLPLGDVLGMAVVMAEPNRDLALRLSRRAARRVSGRAWRPRPCTAFPMRGGQTTRSWASLAGRHHGARHARLVPI